MVPARWAQVRANLCRLSVEPDSCYDLAGVLLWAGTWLALGYFFSDVIVSIAARATALGRMLGLVIVTALVGAPPLSAEAPHCRVSPEALKR